MATGMRKWRSSQERKILKEYKSLRKRYLKPTEQRNYELGGGMRLRSKLSQAFIDRDWPGCKILKRKVTRLEREGRHKEIYEMLKELARYHMQGLPGLPPFMQDPNSHQDEEVAYLAPAEASKGTTSLIKLDGEKENEPVEITRVDCNEDAVKEENTDERVDAIGTAEGEDEDGEVEAVSNDEFKKEHPEGKTVPMSNGKRNENELNEMLYIDHHQRVALNSRKKKDGTVDVICVDKGEDEDDEVEVVADSETQSDGPERKAIPTRNDAKKQNDLNEIQYIDHHQRAALNSRQKKDDTVDVICVDEGEDEDDEVEVFADSETQTDRPERKATPTRNDAKKENNQNEILYIDHHQRADLNSRKKKDDTVDVICVDEIEDEDDEVEVFADSETQRDRHERKILPTKKQNDLNEILYSDHHRRAALIDRKKEDGTVDVICVDEGEDEVNAICIDQGEDEDDELEIVAPPETKRQRPERTTIRRNNNEKRENESNKIVYIDHNVGRKKMRLQKITNFFCRRPRPVPSP